MKTSRITCAILCLLMILALLPAAAFAEEPADVWVGGTNVSIGGYWLISAGKITAAGSVTNYNVHYDAGKGILTLRGADITENYAIPDSDFTAAIYAKGTLTIQLENDNSALGVNSMQNCGIYVTGTLTVGGSGSLSATGGEAEESSYGIYSGDIVRIKSGMVTATGGTAISHSYGIYGCNGVTIENGSITAIGGEADKSSYGIFCSNDAETGSFTMLNGVVTAVSGATSGSYCFSCGVSSDAINISGGKINASGSMTSGSNFGLSYGLSGLNSVTIKNSTITATGGEASSTNCASYGIFSDNILMANSNVTATGSTARGTNCASYGTSSSSITISSGNVTATGGTASGGVSYGIYGSATVAISSGTVLSKGDSSAICMKEEATLSSILSSNSTPRSIKASENKNGVPAVTPGDKLSIYKYLYIKQLDGAIITFTPVPSTVYNDPAVPDATIWLTGSGLDSGDLLIADRDPKGSAYQALLDLADPGDVFAIYNIKLKSGTKSTGYPMNLTFDLNGKYAGQDFTLVHQKADTTYEYFYETGDDSGDLTFGPLYELSPFMLVNGTLAQTQTQGEGNSVGIPNTGDGPRSVLWLAVASAIAAAALAAVALCKRRRD